MHTTYSRETSRNAPIVGRRLATTFGLYACVFLWCVPFGRAWHHQQSSAVLWSCTHLAAQSFVFCNYITLDWIVPGCAALNSRIRAECLSAWVLFNENIGANVGDNANVPEVQTHTYKHSHTNFVWIPETITYAPQQTHNERVRMGFRSAGTITRLEVVVFDYSLNRKFGFPIVWMFVKNASSSITLLSNNQKLDCYNL